MPNAREMVIETILPPIEEEIQTPIEGVIGKLITDDRDQAVMRFAKVDSFSCTKMRMEDGRLNTSTAGPWPELVTACHRQSLAGPLR